VNLDPEAFLVPLDRQVKEAQEVSEVPQVLKDLLESPDHPEAEGCLGLMDHKDQRARLETGERLVPLDPKVRLEMLVGPALLDCKA